MSAAFNMLMAHFKKYTARTKRERKKFFSGSKN